MGVTGVADVLEKAQYPKEWPYSVVDFSRQDEAEDTEFYSFPRFCFHVDDKAVDALTTYYEATFKEWTKPDVLDICASHVSHFPPTADLGKTIALGMNEVRFSFV